MSDKISSDVKNSNLVAINCLSTTTDISNTVFSNGYTPLKFDILDKGFLLLYYPDSYTAMMAAWFFEIKGIPAATLTGWSLLRICGPVTDNELIEGLSCKQRIVSFFKRKRNFSWIAIHGIRTKELLIKSIRDKKWNIIESLNDRGFIDIIETMEMSASKEINNFKENLEYFFVRLLEKKSTNSIYFLKSSDQFKCQQKLILFSRCSKLPTNIDSKTGILPKKTQKKVPDRFNRYSLLAIRKHLYTIPFFLQTCLPNNSLSTLKTEYCRSIPENNLSNGILEGANLLLQSKNNLLCNEGGKNDSKKTIDIYDIFVCMLRVLLIETINRLRIRSKHINVSEIKQIWLDRFGIEVDILQLFQIAGLSEELNEIK